MNKMLEHLINVIHKEELFSMFGENSKVNINKVYYSTNEKKYVVDCTLKATFEIDNIPLNESVGDYLDFYPTGLHIIIKDSWKYLGLEQKIIFVDTLEVN